MVKTSAPGTRHRDARHAQRETCAEQCRRRRDAADAEIAAHFEALRALVYGALSVGGGIDGGFDDHWTEGECECTRDIGHQKK
jgi:hypothetical protein